MQGLSPAGVCAWACPMQRLVQGWGPCSTAGPPQAHALPCFIGRVKPRANLLTDSDAESSSAGSSDEEDVPAAEPSGALGERIVPPTTEG